jgi:hypothetical protein
VQPQTSPLPQEVHGTWWCGDRMEAFIRENARRFFMWTGFIGPHPPYNVPAPWESMYDLGGYAPPDPGGSQRGDPPAADAGAALLRQLRARI